MPASNYVHILGEVVKGDALWMCAWLGVADAQLSVTVGPARKCAPHAREEEVCANLAPCASPAQVNKQDFFQK